MQYNNRMFSTLKKASRILGALVLCAFFSLANPDLVLAGKAGINIGDHFGEVDQAADIVGENGWIVVMAQPGDCSALEEMIQAHPTINFVIRGHHPSVTQMTPDHAKAWAYTLANMDTGGRKIYFYPINEPFTRPEEGFSPDQRTTAVMVNDYVNALMNNPEFPDLKKKVVFLSPMFNRSLPTFDSPNESTGRSNIQAILDVNPGFFEPFDGIAMNLYDFQNSCSGPFCSADPDGNAGEFRNTLEKFGVDKPVYAVEAGVVPGGDGVEYNDAILVPFYEAGYNGGPFDDSQLVMTATFSYDPHRSNWNIYGSQTAEVLRDIDGGTAPIGSEWTEGDAAAFTEFIDTKIADGSVARCDSCGLSPVTSTGEKFCAGTGKYNLEIFPDYQYDEKDYFLYPICVDGQNCREGTVDQRLVAYKKSLIEQGYEVHCAENEINVSGIFGGRWSDYVRLVTQYLPNKPVYDEIDTLQTDSTQIIDYTNLKIPVFRDQSGKRWRMTSIEEFFGFKDIYSGEDPINLLNSSPIEKLLSEEQRCELAVDVLRDARTLCFSETRSETTDGLKECALNTEIPDPANQFGGKKRFDVWDEYAAAGASCKDIVSTENPLKDMLLNTPLYLERAYRIGFLVTSVRHLSPANNEEFFNFMSAPYFSSSDGVQYGSRMTEVNIIAFKIPDVGLSHHPDLKYSDPLQLTRDSVLSTEQQAKRETTQENLQKYFKHNSYTEYRNTGEGGQRWMGGNTVINCALTPGCGGLTPNIDPLFRALVDMINAEKGVNEFGKVVPGYGYNHGQSEDNPNPVNVSGTYQNCKPTRVKITPEAVEVIGDSADIDATHINPEIKDDLSETNLSILKGLIKRLKNGETTEVTETNFPNFITEFKETTTNSPTRIAEINSYLVYPGDYEIGTVADAIRSPFVPFEMAKEVDENRRDGCDPYTTDCVAADVKKEYRFSAIGGLMNFIGGVRLHPFIDGTDPFENCDVSGQTTPNNQADDCKRKNFTLSVISDAQKVVAIPGEKVGFWMREIQKSLSSATSHHYAYLESCTSTEEFLLGSCGGGSIYSPGSNNSNPTSDLPTFTIVYWSGAEVNFAPPPENLWREILAASSRHGCDPLLMVAVAHSESTGYVNHPTENSATAMGTWQFTRDAWQTWTRPGTHQPSTFVSNPSWVDPQQRLTLAASTDAACRLVLWTGVQRYPTSNDNFVRAFSSEGDNFYCQIWNGHSPQADYVYRLWEELREQTSSSPQNQPGGYAPLPWCAI